VLLTANALDFLQLHNEYMTQQREHAGILIVYRENNPSRDMNFYQNCQGCKPNPRVGRAACERISQSKLLEMELNLERAQLRGPSLLRDSVITRSLRARIGASSVLHPK
jgi:hypothetical protein